MKIFMLNFDMDVVLGNVILFCIYIITEVSAENCNFFEGTNTYVRTCSTGCCDNTCCTDDYKTLAIILGTVFGCLLLIIIVAIIVICLTHERWSKRVVPRRDKKIKDDEIVLQDINSKPSE